MTKYGDYCSSLRIINKVLSSITPYSLYCTGVSLRHVREETKQRYVDMFSCNDTRVTVRARRAWVFDLLIMPSHMDMVPAAIQVELTHCDERYGVHLSPSICAYYLMFLNYCGLRQYDNRDRALRQLIDVVNDTEQCGHHRHNSYNIAGHCLLSVGEPEQARDLFIRSYEFTLPYPAYHRHNSAQYYLQCLSNNATNTWTIECVCVVKNKLCINSSVWVSKSIVPNYICNLFHGVDIFQEVIECLLFLTDDHEWTKHFPYRVNSM